MPPARDLAHNLGMCQLYGLLDAAQPIEPHQSELAQNIFEGCVDVSAKHALNTSYSVP